MRAHAVGHLLLALLLLAGGRPARAQQTFPAARYQALTNDSGALYGQRVLLAPGDSAARQFGDVLLCYKLGPYGTSVRCTIYLSTQLVSVQQLNATVPTYPFDVQLGDSKARGTLRLRLLPAQKGQISTLAGDFMYPTGNGEQLAFKGDLVGWHTVP